MKKKELCLALSFLSLMFCFAFTFDEEGIQWLWEGQEQVVLVLLGICIFLIKMKNT